MFSATTTGRDRGADLIGRGALAVDVLAGSLARTFGLPPQPLDLFGRRSRPQSLQIRKNFEEVVASRRLRHPHESINSRLKAVEDGLAMALRVQLQVVGLQLHLIG